MDRILKYSKLSILIAITLQILVMVYGIENEFVIEEQFKSFVTQLIFAFSLTFAINYYNDFISQIYPWEKNLKKRLWIGISGMLIISFVTIVIINFIVIVGFYNLSIEQYFGQLHPKQVLPSFSITIIFVVIVNAFNFFKEKQKQKITEQKIIADTASAKFSALKNQLDPHFLFNSLNVLTSLIEENPDLAQKFTTSLSKVYRYVLEQKNKELITVEDELKFAKTYMTLLKLRFEDSIIFKMPENISDPEAKIVPLSLQILLENTVKHNIVTPERPLKIEIYEKNNVLIVRNNLQPKEVLKNSTGVGLSNVKQRYSLITKREFSVYKTKETFIAELPLLHEQIKNKPSMESSSKELENLKYIKAQKHVEELKGFYGNLTSYLFVITGLAALNYYQNSWKHIWFIWPALGWGIGVVFHGLKTFNISPIFNKDWEERKIRKFMEDEDSNKQLWQ